MYHYVKISDMKVSDKPTDIIATLSLGSCLGVTAYDPISRIGGMIHILLPSSKNCHSQRNSFSFVDTGFPLLFKTLEVTGAVRHRLKIYLAGGASFRSDAQGIFAVGKKNLLAARDIIVTEALDIAGMDIGSSFARSMFLSIETGRVWIESNGKVRDL